MEVAYERFRDLDMRVGRITSAEPIPGRTRVMRGSVDIGSEARQVVIGGAEHYGPEQMVGRTVVVISNLEPRTVAGVRSEAMLLAADVDGRPSWLTVQDGAPPGSRVL